MLVLLFGFLITDLPYHVVTLQIVVYVRYAILKLKTDADIKEVIYQVYLLCLPLLINMTQKLHCARWWPILCPHSRSFFTTRKDISPQQYTVCFQINQSLVVQQVVSVTLHTWKFPQG